ncbi:MAG TPA: asparaginase [Microbacteriaceae bacterium]|nr:asparaginase [Microbacteriaceae bacterium]
MSHPIGVADTVELAILERSGFDESRHIGAAVVVAPNGSIRRELGDGSALIFGRSSLKLLQAIAVLRAGVALEGAELVIASASHGGTAEHVRLVERLLERAALGPDALRCPIDWPLDGGARRAADGPSRITMNCSGKHAAFLLACVTNGWPTETYLDPAHPLQALIRSTIEEFTGEAVAHVGVDGCGAPVFATTVRGLATAVGRVASASLGDGAAPSRGDADAARLSAAIRANPWAIDGIGRANTVVIDELGIVAKGGAEGVMVMGLEDGTAVALKILDGSARAATLVALELLASVGAISRAHADRVIALTTDEVLGGGVPVGRLRASALVVGR